MKRLTFIVHGEQAVVDVPEELPLTTALEWALDDTRSHGSRRLADWEVRHVTGQLVGDGDLSHPVSQYKLTPREWLFVTTAIGAGG